MRIVHVSTSHLFAFITDNASVLRPIAVRTHSFQVVNERRGCDEG